MKGQKRRRGKEKRGKKINGERAARALSNEHVDAPVRAGSTFQLLRVNFYTPKGKIRLGQCRCIPEESRLGTTRRALCGMDLWRF